MTEEKKVVARKTPVRKNVPAKEVEKVEKVVIEDTSSPKRVKRVEIDRNEMIPCRSTTHGDLIYKSNRTNAKFIWGEFGSTIYIEMGELLDMNGQQRTYLHDGYIVVDDEEAAEYLGLTKIYEEIAHIDNLDDLFTKNAEELLVILPKLPKGMKSTLSTKAREMVEDGSLDSIGKIRAIESVLGVDLEGFIKAK